MYKLLVTSLLSVTLSVGTAIAADMGPPPALPTKAPPPPAPTWTGCYVGGGGGAGLMTSNQHIEAVPGFAPITAAVDVGGQGWMGIGGGGCDYQLKFINWNFVLGAFGDYAIMNYRGTASNGGVTDDMTETGAWTGGLRAGVLVAPSVLIYTNGGYTGTRLNLTNFSNTLTAPAQNYNGWFVGGGTETSLSWVLPGLFLRTEYRYASFASNDTQLFFPTGAPAPFASHSNLATQSVFTELVWRFNWTGGWHWQ